MKEIRENKDKHTYGTREAAYTWYRGHNKERFEEK